MSTKIDAIKKSLKLFIYIKLQQKGEINFWISEGTNLRSFLKKEFDEIKWLNINPKPDKECIKHGDIALIFEIITNSMFDKKFYSQMPVACYA
jgi:hypothetical protein